MYNKHYAHNKHCVYSIFRILMELDMARMNITVSDDVREKMNKHVSVNWSKTAADAFTALMNDIESTEGVNNMAEAIARLKASKSKFKDQAKTQGYGFGMAWAMKTADYEELKRISDFQETASNNYMMNEIPASLDELASIITGGDYDFYELLSEGVDSSAYIEGFIDAAMEVLDKVETA